MNKPALQAEDRDQKLMKELMDKRLKSMPCPYKETCTQKVLREEAEMMCNDQETTQEAMLLHMKGNHIFELCKIFQEKRREKEGRFPRDW